MEFVAIPIIVIICSIFMNVLKLFLTNSQKQEEILATLVPTFGSIIAILLYFINDNKIEQFNDPLISIIIGFISGQSALETKSVITTIKNNKNLNKLIQEELQSEDIKDIIKEQVETDEVKDIIKEQINTITEENKVEKTA